MHKQCSGPCGEMKSVSNFLLRKKSIPGKYRAWCKECDAARKAAYRLNHYFEISEYNAKYMAVYYPENAEKFAAFKAERRSRLEFHMTLQDKQETSLWRRKIRNNSCYYCGEIKEKMEDDHLIPLSRGGTDHWWNLERACKRCNTRKKARTHLEFMSL